jgi:hypothetical protein
MTRSSFYCDVAGKLKDVCSCSNSGAIADILALRISANRRHQPMIRRSHRLTILNLVLNGRPAKVAQGMDPLCESGHA